ncbi:molybdopterin-dependent oxidoreductase, partial [Halobium palmae]
MAPTDPESREGRLGERSPALERLSEDPENAQVADRRVLDQLVTERGEHYVRNHYPTPDLDGDDWSISLTGAVDGELSMETLREEFPSESVAHTMECSGNGRAYFDPDAEGHQWEYGAVSTAVWSGAPLDAVLDEFGVGDGNGYESFDDDERWVSVMGADAPEDEETFCRSVPTAKLRRDSLLAYAMNGRPLPPEHGYPVRLVVPGWFGNNSVKWVDRLHVGREMVSGDEWEGFTKYHQRAYRLFFDEGEKEQPTEHADVDTTDTLAMQNADDVRNAYLFDQLPKALVCRPTGDEPVPADDPGRVVGVAWA